MSTKALSIKSQNESTLKDGMSEYHTVYEDDSRPVNNIDGHKDPKLDKYEIEGMAKAVSEFHINKKESDTKILALRAQMHSILDTHNKNMEDYESFKSKFNKTIEKYKRDTITDVESFIEKLIDQSSSIRSKDDSNQLKKVETTFYSFNNNNFLNSTPDEVSFISRVNSERTVNTFVLSDEQLLEKELNSRDLMSENNMREKNVAKTPASYQNIRSLPEKPTETRNYNQGEVDQNEDKYIPIKTTSAKEDLKKKQEVQDYNKDQEDTFFIFKICSYICKKIRRNPIV